MVEKHIPHPHKPKNVNDIVRAQRSTHPYRRFNEKAATWTTWLFSTMEMFWFMDLFIFIWMLGNSIGIWHFDPMPFPLLLFIINIPQLPLLPLLAISQKVIEQKQEIQANEEYERVRKIYADSETIIKQNNEIIALLQAKEAIS